MSSNSFSDRIFKTTCITDLKWKVSESEHKSFEVLGRAFIVESKTSVTSSRLRFSSWSFSVAFFRFFKSDAKLSAVECLKYNYIFQLSGIQQSFKFNIRRQPIHISNPSSLTSKNWSFSSLYYQTLIPRSLLVNFQQMLQIKIILTRRTANHQNI